MMTKMDTGEGFLKALEDHFVSLNGLVRRHMQDAVQQHQGPLREYAKGARVPGSPGKGEQEDEKALRRRLSLHRAILESSQSLFQSITDETPITKLESEMKEAHASMQETIPSRVPVEYPGGHAHSRPGRAFRFRALRKRKSEEKQNAEPEIPVHLFHARQLYRYFLMPEYLHRVAGLVRETRMELARSLSTLLEDENKPVPEVLWETRFQEQLVNYFQDQKETLEALMHRSGTPLSLTGWKLKRRKGNHKNVFSEMEQLERSWRITFFALYEDLRFREHLFAFIQEISLLKMEVHSIVTSRIRTTLYPVLEKQRTLASMLLEKLPDPDTVTMDELKSLLVKELYRLNKEKKIESEEASAMEAAEGIPGILQKLQNGIEEKLEEFPKRIGVVNAPDYAKGIKQSEISYFSPGEFLEFSSFAQFKQVQHRLQAQLGTVLEKLVQEFREFDQIVDFYLDSAIALSQKPGVTTEEVVLILREGMDRLLNTTASSKQMLDNLEQDKWRELSENTDAFIDSVRKLDANENIFHIYSLLLKSKALASSRQNRKRLQSGIKQAYSWSSDFISKHSRWLQASYEDIRKRLKLHSSVDTITAEISNYLAEINRRITQLPVIYQYLFESAPVREMNLFLSREGDTEKLNRALADWERGNFAATLVVGENGSGCSSLLQHYAQTLKSQYPILSFQVERFYSTPDDFYALVGELFNQEGIEDEDSLTRFISSLSEKIVILDGMERIFLRKVHGFECLRRFLSLIVNTSQSIFWVCSVSKIAYHYLNRTLALSEHFDYILDIDNLKGSDIREIIMKRNRLSGYSIQFINSTEEAGEQEVEQAELEEAYFTDLERFAGSNIRLSLICWLQSVQSVGQEGIKVGKFLVPDLAFLENLSTRKTHVLLLIILHGRITERLYALASNCTLEESSALLSMLKEDSILVRNGEVYFLNGILYRHVIKLLKDRNLIH